MRKWLVMSGALLLLCVALGFTKYTQIMAAIAFGESFPEPSETVEAVIAKTELWQPRFEVVGEIKSTRRVELRNEFEGLITLVNFSSGEKVEKGAVLIQQDISTESAQLDAILAQIALSKIDVKRFTELLKTNASSKEQLDSAKAQLAVLEANARSLEASISRKTITAPFDGRTSIHQWEVGAFLPANSLITTLIGNTDTLWVDFSLPQKQAQINIDSEILVNIDSSSTQPVTGRVIAIEQEISAASRSLRVRATLDNREQNWIPGALVNVSVPQSQAIDVFRIPVNALRYDAFGSYVFVLTQDEAGNYRATRREVETLSRDQEFAVISSGINRGDLVATIGAAKLTPDILVNVAETTTSEVSNEQ